MADGTDKPQRTAELRSIEGGRAIAARDVGASFAVDADDLSTMENIAGYAIFVWDDEGGINNSYHFGNRNPFSPCSIPELLRNRLAYNIAGGAD